MKKVLISLLVATALLIPLSASAHEGEDHSSNSSTSTSSQQPQEVSNITEVSNSNGVPIAVIAASVVIVGTGVYLLRTKRA